MSFNHGSSSSYMIDTCGEVGSLHLPMSYTIPCSYRLGAGRLFPKHRHRAEWEKLVGLVKRLFDIMTSLTNSPRYDYEPTQKPRQSPFNSRLINKINRLHPSNPTAYVVNPDACWGSDRDDNTGPAHVLIQLNHCPELYLYARGFSFCGNPRTTL